MHIQHLITIGAVSLFLSFGAGCSKSSSEQQRTGQTLDTISLQVKTVQFDEHQNLSVSMKDTKFEEGLSNGWDQSKFMSTDDKGRTILGGLRDDPTRYRLEGHITGTVTSVTSKDVIANYDFQVTKIIAGKTEVLDDAYLVCKGTYWVPFPVPKPNVPWESVPPTRVYFNIPKSQVGVLLSTEEPASASSNSVADAQFVLTGTFQPALFGKGSRHQEIQ